MESESAMSPTVVATLFVGVSVILLAYILRLFKSEARANEHTKNDLSVQTEKKREVTKPASKKKNAGERWNPKGANFTHHWVLSTFKGHTGEISNMDYSSNGKYLASCGYEDPDPGGKEDPAEDSSSSGKEESQSSGGDRSPLPKGLSRRQRKNRRREDGSPSESKKKLKPKKVEVSKKSINMDIYGRFVELNVNEQALFVFLERYSLKRDFMVHLGYPVDDNRFEGVWIFKNSKPFSAVTYNQQHNFDVNAREFVPGGKPRSCSSTDSGQGSSSENDYEDTSGSDQECGGQNDTHNEHLCSRCGKTFRTKNKKYLATEKCVYHWGKLKALNRERVYTCCERGAGGRGCTEGACHVWSGLKNGPNGPYQGYVRTRTRRNRPDFHGIYAVDCEMCYTVAGLELAKVTVINHEGRLVYDSHVKPDNRVVDYNTRFSGITAKDLKGAKSLRDVQNDLMGFINDKTILIGHGLENDLKALKIIHFKVVDTALCFPHHHGLPYRRSLKELVSTILAKDIQCSEKGHSSWEDASACLELVLWKVKKDYFVNHC
ncbi:unnamed protein product [Brassicogethes aeneus]|uniref:Exonuclease domain-containing protein n=1 Tax=Brassicogethes aeneus TaxID=1431903 RepID=A0A9P0BGB8_BRAAE|nr:unnamed protein product [Brassicogethes aeneus]